VVSRIAWLLLTFSVALAGCSPAASVTPSPLSSVSVVAAENFYGDVVQQIGGPLVKVTSVLSNPNADPHLYESSVADAQAVASAQLVIENGAGYDSWMDHLLSASPRSSREVINVAQSFGVAQGANPHLWYNPTVMPVLARLVETRLERLLPAKSTALRQGLSSFLSSLDQLHSTCAQLDLKHAGAVILPTEPVADYLLSACGLQAVNGPFQVQVEQGNDPPAAAVRDFRDMLLQRRAAVLIYNTQTVSPITQSMRDLAKQQGIPVIGVSETLPLGLHFQDWQLRQLQAVAAALG
jgi:zinc/manganese transport system substrate-binding protein